MCVLQQANTYSNAYDMQLGIHIKSCKFFCVPHMFVYQKTDILGFYVFNTIDTFFEWPLPKQRAKRASTI